MKRINDAKVSCKTLRHIKEITQVTFLGTEVGNWGDEEIYTILNFHAVIQPNSFTHTKNYLI